MDSFAGFLHLKNRLSGENDFLSFFKQVLSAYFTRTRDFSLLDQYLEDHLWANENTGQILDIYIMAQELPYIHLLNAMLSVIITLPLSVSIRLHKLALLSASFKQKQDN